MAPLISGGVGAYLRALARHWGGVIVGATFFVLLTVIPAFLGWEVPRWLWGLALGLALIPANFLAWRHERRLVEQLQGMPGEGVNAPTRKLPIGRYIHAMQKDEREDYERLKKDLKRKEQEISSLRRQLGLPH